MKLQSIVGFWLILASLGSLHSPAFGALTWDIYEYRCDNASTELTLLIPANTPRESIFDRMIQIRPNEFLKWSQSEHIGIAPVQETAVIEGSHFRRTGTFSSTVPIPQEVRSMAGVTRQSLFPFGGWYSAQVEFILDSTTGRYVYLVSPCPDGVCDDALARLQRGVLFSSILDLRAWTQAMDAERIVLRFSACDNWQLLWLGRAEPICLGSGLAITRSRMGVRDTEALLEWNCQPDESCGLLFIGELE